ncbi:MAG: GtrA family protein [Anaerobutyricum soehngenii]|jgi:gtrA-like protein
MKKLFIQAIRFIGLSGIGWILDFTTYTVLGVISANLVLNNTISSWVGVTFVFLLSTRIVFKNNSKIPLKWKYVIYLLYQCVLIFFISKLLNRVNIYLLTHVTLAVVKNFSTIISKILVTPITMVLNFIVMKNVIEKI